MESTADNDAIKEMLQQWAGEDTEIVFEKLRKLQSIEKIYRGKTSTDRIHDVPKSYGKFAGLATNQKLKICKLWSLIKLDERSELLVAARKEADEVADGAAASKQHNTHSDEMARVGHLLSYPGATSSYQ